MSRIILLSLALLGSFLIIEEAEALRYRTRLLYGQAFRDGFRRGLAGDLAVVTYTPVRKGRFVYYYQVPHYFTKYGIEKGYAHAHPHLEHSHTQYGVGHRIQPYNNYGVGHGLQYGVGHQSYGHGHAYSTGEYGAPGYSPQY